MATSMNRKRGSICKLRKMRSSLFVRRSSIFLHERSQWGALGLQGVEKVEGFVEGVFGGDAVAGKGVEPGDVDGDGAGVECFVIEAIDLADFPDCGGDGTDARFFG